MMRNFCIDLTDSSLSQEQQKALRFALWQLHLQNPDSALKLDAYTIYTIEDAKSKQDLYEFSHPLIRLPADNTGETIHFLALAPLSDPKKTRQGCFSTITEVVSCIAINPDFISINHQPNMLVKCSRPEEPSSLTYLEKEYRIGSKIPHMGMKHPVLVDEKKGIGYLPMKKIPGLTLVEVIREQLKDVGMYGRLQLAVAILKAYQNQIASLDPKNPLVHSDLKPENIMVDWNALQEGKENAIGIIDFGLSRFTNDIEQFSYHGSPLYSENPVAKSQKQNFLLRQNTASDIYSLLLCLMEIFGDDRHVKIDETEILVAFNENLNILPRVKGIRDAEVSALKDLYTKMGAVCPSDRPYTLQQIINLLTKMMADRKTEAIVRQLPSGPNQLTDNCRDYYQKERKDKIKIRIDNLYSQFGGYKPDPIPAWWNVYNNGDTKKESMDKPPLFELNWQHQARHIRFNRSLSILTSLYKTTNEWPNFPERNATLQNLWNEWLDWRRKTTEKWKSEQNQFELFMDNFSQKTSHIEELDRTILSATRNRYFDFNKLAAVADPLYKKQILSTKRQKQLSLLIESYKKDRIKRQLADLKETPFAYCQTHFSTQLLSLEELNQAFNEQDTTTLQQNHQQLMEARQVLNNCKEIITLLRRKGIWKRYPVYPSVKSTINALAENESIDIQCLRQIIDSLHALDECHIFCSIINEMPEIQHAIARYPGKELTEWANALPLLRNQNNYRFSIELCYKKIHAITDPLIKFDIMSRFTDNICRIFFRPDEERLANYEFSRLKKLIQHHISKGMPKNATNLTKSEDKLPFSFFTENNKMRLFQQNQISPDKLVSLLSHLQKKNTRDLPNRIKKLKQLQNDLAHLERIRDMDKKKQSTRLLAEEILIFQKIDVQVLNLYDKLHTDSLLCRYVLDSFYCDAGATEDKIILLNTGLHLLAYLPRELYQKTVDLEKQYPRLKTQIPHEEQLLRAISDADTTALQNYGKKLRLLPGIITALEKCQTFLDDDNPPVLKRIMQTDLEYLQQERSLSGFFATISKLQQWADKLDTIYTPEQSPEGHGMSLQ